MKKTDVFSQRKLRSIGILFFCLIFNSAIAQWQIVHVGGNQQIMNFCIVDSSTVVALGNNGEIYRSIDTGYTWTLDTTLAGGLKLICEGGPDTLFAGGKELFRSDDAGVTWQHVSTFKDTISDMIFLNSPKGYAIIPKYQYCYSSTGTILHPYFDVVSTIDYGSSWQTMMTAIGNNTFKANDLVKFDNDNAFILASSTQIVAHCGGPIQNESKYTHDSGNIWSPLVPLGGDLSNFIQMNDSMSILRENVWLSSWIKLNRNTLQYSVIPLFFNGIGDYSGMTFMNEFDGYIISSDSIFESGSTGLLWNFEYKSPQLLRSLERSTDAIVFCGGDSGLILRKQHISSLLPDTIRQLKLSSSQLNYSYVLTNDTSTKTIQITSQSNVPIDVEVVSGSAFKISDISGNYTDTLLLSMTPLQTINLSCRFTPGIPGAYFDSITFFITGADTIILPVYGVGYNTQPGPVSYLSGSLLADSVFCSDTLIIQGAVTIPVGVAMTICPGTKVLFADNYKISVYGELRCDGTAADPISFSSLTGNHIWNGILIDNGNITDSSIFTNTHFSGRCDANMIQINQGNVKILNCSIVNENTSNLMSNCIYSLNTGIGINLELMNCHIRCDNCIALGLFNADGAIVMGNEISGSYIAFRSVSGKGIKFTNNELHHNVIGIQSNCEIDITGNRVYSNQQAASIEGKNVRILNNSFYNNSPDGALNIRPYGGVFQIIQNLIYNNYSDFDSCAGLYINQTTTWDTTSLLCMNNTVCNNSCFLQNVGMDFKLSSVFDTLISGKVLNNIIYNTSFPELSANIRNVDVLVQNNFIHANSTQNWDTTNISGNPGFKYSSDSIGAITSIDQLDWKLVPASVCIDRGNISDTTSLPLYDFSGKPRIENLRVDLGVYEGDVQLVQGADNNEFLVFPNPSSDYIELPIIPESSNRYRILSASGQVIVDEDLIIKQRINIEGMERGLYILELIGTYDEILYSWFIKY